MANRDHPLYETWKGMRNRCLNKTSTSYKNCGAKGITICPEWDSFTQFALDMGPKPAASYTLDRKDSNKNYTPENCRWATAAQQNEAARKNNPKQLSNTGVMGVRWLEKHQVFVVAIRVAGITKQFYRGTSFTDACAVRAEWDAQNSSVPDGFLASKGE